MAIILSSPSFIYLNEPRQGEETVEISDHELAVRLSYFLWSSPPDKTLLNLAKKGKMKNPNILTAQVNRMMHDPRFDHFIESFTHQWLHMSRLDFFQFNYDYYPEYDDSTKSSARQQVYETIRYMIKNDLPIQDLLKSDYAVINNVMADYYGLEKLEGEHFETHRLKTEFGTQWPVGDVCHHGNGLQWNQHLSYRAWGLGFAQIIE